MQFEVTYTTKRTFEIPEGATDEEYDAMKQIIMASIEGAPVSAENVKVVRLDTPPVEPPPYEINKDCDQGFTNEEVITILYT